MTYKFDSILVGAGQAAPSLAKRLSEAGRKIAFVERHRFGGTCVNTGCMPTKTWIASARAAHMIRRAGDFGFTASGPQSDMTRIKARKDQIVHDASSGVEEGIRKLRDCQVFLGTAHFEDERTLRVGDDLLQAPEIFLNVGARATVPGIAGLRQLPFLTNTSILELTSLPRHLVILGGSYIALEFAQMFRRFGSDVTVLQRGERLIAREDPDLADALMDALRGEGIHVELNVDVTGAEQVGGDILVRWTHGEVRGSHLLIATGRQPNTDDLRAEKASIKLDAKGFIPVNDRLETETNGIWALGDCNGRGAFTHTSYNDYEIVAANLLDGEDRKVSDRITAYNIYTDPPLARIGMSEAEVRRTGKPALKAVRPMTKVSRAVEKAETLGFLKVLVDKESDLILGAALLGIECDEVVHSLLNVMYAKRPYTLITRSMPIHPTVSELLPSLLGDLQPL